MEFRTGGSGLRVFSVELRVCVSEFRAQGTVEGIRSKGLLFRVYW